ncbi:MAG: hypothetical protein MUP48_04125 [Wolbachia endosymbiont of Homalodisca vitripennis]|nr:hypothetical protein [Wolbachia endosymbiont of Homalodisca vitripennis]MCJ7476195.1 hypothetical protein [Wolbachia endosymbiont of Homalodisca vitripennis]
MLKDNVFDDDGKMDPSVKHWNDKRRRYCPPGRLKSQCSYKLYVWALDLLYLNKINVRTVVHRIEL